LANFSPRVASTLGKTKPVFSTLKGLMPHMPKPFQGLMVTYFLIPGLSLRSNTGLKLANAFGVFSNLDQFLLRKRLRLPTTLGEET